ncbi:MAG: ABC transporter ATP-binding protein [Tannerellaceae bacterium]|jgi:ABC-2 type transport system ATP-binding protein|nr:ABC transporter ATP-binding protein [Tannerellaceae bacterium]
MTPQAVSVDNLRKTYRGGHRPALDNLSLQIAQGEIYGLLGPNGAGKTTLIQILCGLLRADSGQASILNLPIPLRMAQIKPLIGVVPQDIALYPSLTISENLCIFGGIYGIGKQTLQSRIASLLAMFGLETQRKKILDACSGGMKRCVNLIAGILHTPRILFLDEPTVGIDVGSRRLILDNLQMLNRQGCTIVYTSHHMEEAQELCTRVAFVNHGRLIAEGKPQDLMDEHGVNSLEALYLSELKAEN